MLVASDTLDMTNSSLRKDKIREGKNRRKKFITKKKCGSRNSEYKEYDRRRKIYEKNFQETQSARRKRKQNQYAENKKTNKS